MEPGEMEVGSIVQKLFAVCNRTHPNPSLTKGRAYWKCKLCILYLDNTINIKLIMTIKSLSF